MKTLNATYALMTTVALVFATPAFALSSMAGPAVAAGPAAAATPAPLPVGRTVSVWQGGSASLLVGQSYASAFDIGLLFNPASERLQTATLTLAFVGAATPDPIPLEVLVVPRSPGFEDTFTTYADPLDSVNILFGGPGGQTGTANDAAARYAMTSEATGSAPVFGLVSQCTNGGLFAGRTCIQVPGRVGDIFSYDRFEGYRGAFSFASGLDATSLQALSTTGQLRYAFTVQSGGVALQSALLTFTAVPVPEPASAWLAIAGLTLVAPWVARRRRVSMLG